MVQSAVPSGSEDEVSEKEVEEVNEETTEEVVVVTKEEVQESKLTTSESPVMVETEEPSDTEAKDTSMKLEDLQGEDEAVIFEMEPVNVSMGNVSMEQIDVTEESFEQASDLVVLTPMKEAENEVGSEEIGDDVQEETTEDNNEEIQTVANQVIADSIEGAITEVTKSDEIESVEESEDGDVKNGARKCEDAAPDVIACQSPPPDFVIPDKEEKSEETEADQNEDIEEATIKEEVSAPNKCDDAGPDVIACQSPPADFVTPDDEIESDIPVIEAPPVMVCSSYQHSNSEESEDDQTEELTEEPTKESTEEQTEEVNATAEDITVDVDVGEEVTAANKCDNAGPEVIACQSPPVDFVIPESKNQNNETKIDESENIETEEVEPTDEAENEVGSEEIGDDVQEEKADEESAKIDNEEVAPEENNEERSTLVIVKDTDSPAAEDTKSEGQTDEKTDDSNTSTKDCPKPTPQKSVAHDETKLKLLTGQAMNLALSYATFIIKDTNLQHNLENYRVG